MRERVIDMSVGIRCSRSNISVATGKEKNSIKHVVHTLKEISSQISQVFKEKMTKYMSVWLVIYNRVQK